ncbi:MAG: D-2-hydroxyacid dehydrogenase [Oscillospiraceae bacterium]|nr:D-2-hydroxyacid dehydrogenase [Oscillospiraceae bacterium]
MSKTIGVIIDFLNDDYRRQIDAAAAKHGYTTRYYPDSASAVGNADDCEILFGHCSRKVIASAKSLKWFCCCWAGVDQFCADELYRNADCLLSNSSGAYGVTIAEHLIMTSLMLLRRQMEYTEVIRAGEWRVLKGGIRSLYGSRVTVLGAGDIGTEFARRVRAFRPAKLVGVRRSAKAGDEAFDEMRTTTELDSVLPETDLLVMALPNTPDTVKILDARRMALLPEGAYVINVGRGAAVDQDALIEALADGRLAGAALDVVTPEPLPAEHPLRAARNLLLTPHVAGNMTLAYTQQKSVSMFLEDLERFTAGMPLVHAVDRRRGY